VYEHGGCQSVVVVGMDLTAVKTLCGFHVLCYGIYNHDV